MRSLLLALLLALVGAGPAWAGEPGGSAAEQARQTMREAMMKQATLPVRPAVMPSTRPDGGARPPERPAPGAPKGELQRGAVGAGVRDADAMRAEMANRAATGNSASGTLRQTNGDMMNAPMMQRSQGMNPGGGMIPGGGTGGGGMGPGGMGPGGGMRSDSGVR